MGGAAICNTPTAPGLSPCATASCAGTQSRCCGKWAWTPICSSGPPWSDKRPSHRALGAAGQKTPSERHFKSTIKSTVRRPYPRVSTDRQTVENQRQALEQVARHRGWEIVATYSDKG